MDKNAMVKGPRVRYQENDELTHLINILRISRKLAGYTQDNFGKQIGLSRETINHIEGLYENTVLSLECEVVKRWYSICAQRLSKDQMDTLYRAIHDYLFPR